MPDETDPRPDVYARIEDHDEFEFAYMPDLDGDPDPGEVVWAWVPFEDDQSKGKDRPALVVGVDEAELVLVALTTHGREDDPEYLPVGSGRWDASGRPSFAKLNHLLRARPEAIRREGAVMPRDRFAVVVRAVRDRFGDEPGL